jgi:hypothetical protein
MLSLGGHRPAGQDPTFIAPPGGVEGVIVDGESRVNVPAQPEPVNSFAAADASGSTPL